jgi:hypothetical protein
MASPLDITISIKNQDDLDRLKKQIDQETEAIAKLAQQLRAHNITEAQFIAQSKPHAEQIANMTKEVGKLEHANRSLVGVTGAAGQGLLQVGYAIDDVQYGFRAIVNNIPQMGMSIGKAIGMSAEGAMALAGGVGIAAVAVSQLYTHWDQIAQLWGQGKTETEIKNMEELAKAVEEAAKSYEKLKEKQPEYVDKAKAAAGKELGGVAAEELASSIALALEKENPIPRSIMVPDFAPRGFGEASKPDRKLGPGNPEYDKFLKSEREKLQKQAEGLVGGLGTQAATDRILGLMETSPENFYPDQKARVEASSPQAMIKKQQDIKTNKQLNEAGASNERMWRAQMVADEKKEKLIKEWDEQNTKDAKEAFEKEKAAAIAKEQMHEDILERNKTFLKRSIRDTSPSQMFGSTRAFAANNLQNNLNAVAKDQLKKLEAIDMKMKDVRDNIQKLGGMRFNR